MVAVVVVAVVAVVVVVAMVADHNPSFNLPHGP